MTQKVQGTIKNWNDDKGFGFIKVESGEDLFFHISDYQSGRHIINNKTSQIIHVRPKVGETVGFIEDFDIVDSI